MTESNALIAAAALLHQIDIGDFTDSLGHSAKMLKAVGDLRAALASQASTPVGQVAKTSGEGWMPIESEDSSLSGWGQHPDSREGI